MNIYIMVVTQYLRKGEWKGIDSHIETCKQVRYGYCKIIQQKNRIIKEKQHDLRAEIQMNSLC